MRSTDPDPVAGNPVLGERVAKAPASTSELLKPKPEGPSGIVIDDNGRRSTTTHSPEGTPDDPRR